MNDDGVFILISPVDGGTEEYRVTYLEQTLNWDFTQSPEEVLSPPEVKTLFDKVEVFTTDEDAQEEAYRLVDNLYLTQPTIYRIYISTPYPQWNTNPYEKNQTN